MTEQPEVVAIANNPENPAQLRTNTTQLVDDALQRYWNVDRQEVINDERLAVLFVDNVIRNSSPVGIGGPAREKVVATKHFLGKPRGGEFNFRHSSFDGQFTEQDIICMQRSRYASLIKTFNAKHARYISHTNMPGEFALAVAGTVDELRARIFLINGHHRDTLKNAVFWIRKSASKATVIDTLQAFYRRRNPLMLITTEKLALQMLPISVEPFKRNTDSSDELEITNAPRELIRDPWERTKFNDIVLRGVECGHRYSLKSILLALQSRRGSVPSQPLVCPLFGCSQSFTSIESLCIDLAFMRTLPDTKRIPSTSSPRPTDDDHSSTSEEDSWSADPEFEYPETKREAYKTVIVLVEAEYTRRQTPQGIVVPQLRTLPALYGPTPNQNQLYLWGYKAKYIEMWYTRFDTTKLWIEYGRTLEEYICQHYERAYKKRTGVEIHLVCSEIFPPIQINPIRKLAMTKMINLRRAAENHELSPGPRSNIPPVSNPFVRRAVNPFSAIHRLEELPSWRSDAEERPGPATILGKRTSPEYPTPGVPQAKRAEHSRTETPQNVSSPQSDNMGLD